MAQRIIVDQQAQKHIQAYLDYDNMVGQTNGNKLLSEKEYQKLKQDINSKQKERIYVAWRNIKKNECKYVGPATKCFCNHRFKEHNYFVDSSGNKKPHCKVKGCSCNCFYYIPTHGSYDFKCLCKHSFKEHDPVSKKCKRTCAGCHSGFSSTWSCSCGLKFNDHKTVVENREERIASGYSVEDQYNLAQNIEGGGGLNQFSNMVGYGDGYEKNINDMGGMSGIGNKHAPIGYRKMEAVMPEEEEKMSPKEKKKKSILANLNKRLQQEKDIDQYDHFEDADQQQEQHQQEWDLLNQNRRIISNNNNNSNYINNNPNNYLAKYNNNKDIEGSYSAFTLYQTPHQFSRIQVRPIMNTKY